MFANVYKCFTTQILYIATLFLHATSKYVNIAYFDFRVSWPPEYWGFEGVLFWEEEVAPENVY